MAAKEKAKPKGGAEELAALYPGARYVKIRVNTAEPGQPAQFQDQQVRVDELDITQCGQIGDLLAKLLVDANDDVNLLTFAVENKDEAIRAVSIAIGVSPDVVSKYSASSFFAVAQSVYEVNHDFFVRRVGNLARRRFGDGYEDDDDADKTGQR